MGTSRRLVAIFYADVAGYSRLTGADEEGTHRRVMALLDEVTARIGAAGGEVLRYAGDAILAVFPSVVLAVDTSAAIQTDIATRNADVPADERVEIRIGINVGDVITDRGEVYGEGVNLAARLEAAAAPGGLCISASAHEQCRRKSALTFRDGGEQAFKNIDGAVRVWHWTPEGLAAPAAGRDAPLALPDKPSIAVLPFTNMSSDPEHEHFADGISEDIITALSKLSKLFVVARNSTFTYKGRAVDVRQIGREQGVRYVLEGSVQRSGQRLRITAQLIDATTGHHVWAQRYDRATLDLFDLQDELTRQVTSALQIELTDGEEARLWAGGTQNLEAWEATIQVPELLHSHRRADVQPARRLVERALELDPGYASAWAMLGWSYWNEVFNGWTDDPDGTLHLASDALKRAQAIDDKNPDTLALLAFLNLSLRRYDDAWRLIEAAMEMGPNNSFAPAVAANIALYCNEPGKMIPMLRRARRLCPVYPAWYLGDEAFAYLLMDRPTDAVAVAGEAARLDPDYIYSYYVLAVVHAEHGQADKARRAVDEILRIEPRMTVATFATSQPYRDAPPRDRILDGLRKAGLPD